MRVVVLCPVDVIAVGEEFAAYGGDESGGGGGLLANTVEGEFDL